MKYRQAIERCYMTVWDLSQSGLLVTIEVLGGFNNQMNHLHLAIVRRRGLPRTIENAEKKRPDELSGNLKFFVTKKSWTVT